jgi:hypothetical protein
MGQAMFQNRWSRSACALIAGLTLAAAASAAVMNQNSTYPIPGVDSNSNPTPSMSGMGSGKIYKDSTTGILLGVYVGIVPNLSGRSLTFSNQGLTITDPWTSTNHVATADQEIVSTPTHALSPAALVLLYVPGPT